MNFANLRLFGVSAVLLVLWPGFAILSGAAAQSQVGSAPRPVSVQDFPRAETDMYFSGFVKQGAFGKFQHRREPISVDKQDVIRTNRDTLYSEAVFDLDAGPVTIVLPDSGKRYMALLIVNEEAYSPAVVYAPGRYTFSKEEMGTRYISAVIRTLVDPNDPKDIEIVHQLQDRIKAEQAGPGKFEIPDWDPVSQKKIRESLLVLSSMEGENPPPRFGWKDQVDPIAHLIATASGWGGNPLEAAKYNSVYPKSNDGRTVYKLTVKDVPVDGFWSITVYNKEGYMVKNELAAYSVNNITAKPNADGSVTVQFGGCQKQTLNCLPTVPGWNYVVRMYRPGPEILNGSWKFPAAESVK